MPLARRIDGKTNTARPDADGAAATDHQPRGLSADAAQLGQIGQVTPWGQAATAGEIGSPDRRQTVTLNPQDQARLGQERSIKSRLLSMILGGAQGMGGQPGGGMQQAQGKQGQAQPMPAMNEPQPQTPPMPTPQPAMQQQMQQQPMGPMGPTGQYGDPTLEEMMARQNGDPYMDRYL